MTARSPSADSVRGAVIMVAAILLIPVMDAAAKLLGTGTPPFGPPMSPLQVSFASLSFQVLFLAPVVFWVFGWATLQPPRRDLLIWRGTLIVATNVSFFAALLFMGMAEAAAIFFVEPLILTVVSAFFLSERIGWRRIAAVLTGLIGAVIVIRPNFLAVGWAALLPLAAAMSFTAYLLLTKITSRVTDPFIAHFWAGCSGAVFLAGVLMIAMVVAPDVTVGLNAAPIMAIWPTQRQWGLLAGLGLIATITHLLIIVAFSKAPASVLAPLQYFEIIAATALGWVLFDEFPDGWTWVGLAIIVLSGLFVFHRKERRNGGVY